MVDRHAAVAGTFYESDGRLLHDNVAHLLATAGGTVAIDAGERNPKVLIAPHAGHVYSGEVAANVYARVQRPAEIRRVVLLGPSHRVGFRGIATSTASHYATPLGRIPLAAAQELAGHDGVGALDADHAEEHSLEVHLPFLQVLLGSFELLPLVVGDAPADLVASVIDRLWGDSKTLIVVSTDLSHFHDYSATQQLDLHISVSPPQPMLVNSRAELLSQLRPGVDGLILAEGPNRATYLPSVGEQLPEPEQFVSELRRKAGLGADGWSSATRVQRYTTFEFS